MTCSGASLLWLSGGAGRSKGERHGEATAKCARCYGRPAQADRLTKQGKAPKNQEKVRTVTMKEGRSEEGRFRRSVSQPPAQGAASTACLVSPLSLLHHALQPSYASPRGESRTMTLPFRSSVARDFLGATTGSGTGRWRSDLFSRVPTLRRFIMFSMTYSAAAATNPRTKAIMCVCKQPIAEGESRAVILRGGAAKSSPPCLFDRLLSNLDLANPPGKPANRRGVFYAFPVSGARGGGVSAGGLLLQVEGWRGAETLAATPPRFFRFIF